MNLNEKQKRITLSMRFFVFARICLGKKKVSLILFFYRTLETTRARVGQNLHRSAGKCGKKTADDL